jgi:pimeloyl-ACP methyl ester carboxylesterase
MFIVERIRMTTMKFSKQQVISVVLGQGGRLFPRLVGRLAFELFCRTDDPNKLGEGEKAAISRAAPLMAEARHHRLNTSSGWVIAHQFRANRNVPYRGKALVVHGWRSRTDFMAKMIASLNAVGWDVVGLDLPGHGQSSGRRLNVKLGVDAVSAVNTWFGPFDLAIGHSFGGVVAVNAAVGGIKGVASMRFKRIVVIASPNSMPQMFKSVARYFNLRANAHRAMEDLVESVAGKPLATYVLSQQLVQFDGAVLVVHAPEDREVSFAGAEAMAMAGPHVTLLPFQGLGHRRIIADEKVFAAIEQFAVKTLSNAA